MGVVCFNLNSNPLPPHVSAIRTTYHGTLYFVRAKHEWEQVYGNYWWENEDGFRVTTMMRNPSEGDVCMLQGSSTTERITSIVRPSKRPGQIRPYNGVLSFKKGSAVEGKINVHEAEVPAHPFYIRWINHLGGYDYFMFACNHKRKLSLTANEYYEPYGSDGVTRSYHKAAKEAVEVSTGIVDKQTLDALARMPLSPDIRWYKESTREWVPIQIESGDTEIMVEQPTGELLFSFIVPVIVR